MGPLLYPAPVGAGIKAGGGRDRARHPEVAGGRTSIGARLWPCPGLSRVREGIVAVVRVGGWFQVGKRGPGRGEFRRGTPAVVVVGGEEDGHSGHSFCFGELREGGGNAVIRAERSGGLLWAWHGGSAAA
jgi:hypothetical protein